MYSISGYMRTSVEVWTDLEVELPIQSLGPMSKESRY